MRLETDYDSFSAAILIVIIVILGAFNPFLPIFYPSGITSSPPVITNLPLIYVQSRFQYFFELNLMLESFVLGAAAALALYFKNLVFGAVAELQNGTAAGLTLMPGGRKAVFASIFLSAAVVPYLLYVVPALAVIYISGNEMPLPYSLLLIGFNFIPVLGLTSVTLATGLISRRQSLSLGLGLAYLSFGILLTALSFATQNQLMILLSALFDPSSASNASLSTGVGVWGARPVFWLSYVPPAAPFFLAVLLTGLIFNTLLFYLLYFYWTRKASF